MSLKINKIDIMKMHRSSVMNMLTSPALRKGQGYCDAVHPMPMSTTVKVKDAATMKKAFISLIDFDWQRDDDILGVEAIYRRIGNTIDPYLNLAMTIAEGKNPRDYWALSYSDGMRAINSAIEFRMKPGDEIIIGKPLYGCTDNYFSGIAVNNRGYIVKDVDMSDPSKVIEAVNKKTKTVYFESVTNPNLQVFDIGAISKGVKEKNNEALVIVDNTFPSPMGCNPLSHGADIVVHSATKSLGGFTQEMAGFVVLPKNMWMDLFLFRKDTGGVPAPQQTHAILTRGLPTLYDRFLKMQDNAKKIAEYLKVSDDVKETIYPGLENYKYFDIAHKLLTDWDGNFAPGFMITFIPQGKNEAKRESKGKKIIDYISKFGEGVITSAVSLGGNKSLIEMPFLGTHATVPAEDKEKMGIDAGMIRLSVGLGRSADKIGLLNDAFNYAYAK